jgi:hypothetical protein
VIVFPNVFVFRDENYCIQLERLWFVR